MKHPHCAHCRPWDSIKLFKVRQPYRLQWVWLRQLLWFWIDTVCVCMCIHKISLSTIYMRVHYKWYEKIALLVVVWSKFLALSLPRNPSSQPVAIEDELLVRIIALHLFLRQAQERSRSYHILTVKRFLHMNLSTLWCLSSLACWGVMKASHLLFLLTEKSRVGERKKESKRLTFHSLSLSHDLKKDGPIHLARKKDRAGFLHIHHVKNSSISPHEPTLISYQGCKSLWGSDSPWSHSPSRWMMTCCDAADWLVAITVLTNSGKARQGVTEAYTILSDSINICMLLYEVRVFDGLDAWRVTATELPKVKFSQRGFFQKGWNEHNFSGFTWFH